MGSSDSSTLICSGADQRVRRKLQLSKACSTITSEKNWGMRSSRSSWSAGTIKMKTLASRHTTSNSTRKSKTMSASSRKFYTMDPRREDRSCSIKTQAWSWRWRDRSESSECRSRSCTRISRDWWTTKAMWRARSSRNRTRLFDWTFRSSLSSWVRWKIKSKRLRKEKTLKWIR